MIKNQALLPLLLLPVITLGIATTASSAPINRSNWMPNVGRLASGEQPLGDMWTFNCPPGGSVSIAVDTKDDTDTGQATTDPVLVVADGQGNVLAAGDDNFACTYAPVCGYSCPQVVDVACGKPLRHSVVVRDFGTASNTGTQCVDGGGYEMTIEVLFRGRPLPEKLVNVGGGPRRSVPKWAINEGKAPIGPALDDENVPIQFSAQNRSLIEESLTK